MADAKFQFDSEKFVQVLAYLAQARLPRLDKLKAAKLLYFCDKYHLLRYGRPVLGDVYFCLDHGPVPSASLNLMNDAITPICIKGMKQPFLEMFAKYLAVDHKPAYPEFISKEAPEFDLLSKSELEALDATIKKYGKYTPWRLRELTHADPTWTVPDDERPHGSRAQIPYDLFFEGQPDAVREMWELVEDEQEESEFADKISR